MATKVYQATRDRGCTMTRAIISIAMLAVGLATASAADIRPVRKAPPPPAPIVYSWSGIYIGGHIGHGWARWSSRTEPGPQPTVGLPGRNFDSDPRGWVGGAQLGFNWQLAPNWVVGVEADISWADANVSDNAPITTTAGVVVAGSNQFTTRDLKWLSTVRGRIGYAWDRVLLYVTGGVAWGKATYSANYATVAVAYPIAPFSQTKTGYVLGGGLEYAVTSYLTIRGEYLHYRFDGADATCLCNPPFFVAYHWDNTTLNVVRLGINYKLDWAGPVVARY